MAGCLRRSLGTPGSFEEVVKDATHALGIHGSSCTISSRTSLIGYAYRCCGDSQGALPVAMVIMSGNGMAMMQGVFGPYVYQNARVLILKAEP